MIKGLNMATEMWEKIKSDATKKSMLFLIDAEEQLTNMKLTESSEPHTHLTELKHHFELMVKDVTTY